jgi:hypothetical protein
VWHRRIHKPVGSVVQRIGSPLEGAFYQDLACFEVIPVWIFGVLQILDHS